MVAVQGAAGQGDGPAPVLEQSAVSSVSRLNDRIRAANEASAFSVMVKTLPIVRLQL